RPSATVTTSNGPGCDFGCGELGAVACAAPAVAHRRNARDRMRDMTAPACDTRAVEDIESPCNMSRRKVCGACGSTHRVARSVDQGDRQAIVALAPDRLQRRGRHARVPRE